MSIFLVLCHDEKGKEQYEDIVKFPCKIIKKFFLDWRLGIGMSTTFIQSFWGFLVNYGKELFLLTSIKKKKWKKPSLPSNLFPPNFHFPKYKRKIWREKIYFTKERTPEFPR
jgi:hypothetical protein